MADTLAAAMGTCTGCRRSALATSRLAKAVPVDLGNVPAVSHGAPAAVLQAAFFDQQPAPPASVLALPGLVRPVSPPQLRGGHGALPPTVERHERHGARGPR